MRGGWGWLCAAVMAGARGEAERPATDVLRTEVVRTGQLELLDEAGLVVGRFGVTERGVELVLGGQAQVSLVTERSTAALNLVGDEVIVRLLGSEGAHVVQGEDVRRSPF
jgi:hypothetical protein